MGNWRNRPPRRLYSHDRYRRSSYCYEESTQSRLEDDGVPAWEKKFCSSMGVPWRKVVDVQKYKFSDDIFSWDDSAGKEAFQEAKRRFWAKINGRRCNIPLPDWNMYVDEVDWNAEVDPELIQHLEDIYLAPTGDGDSDSGHRAENHVLAAVAPPGPTGWDEGDGPANALAAPFNKEDDNLCEPTSHAPRQREPDKVGSWVGPEAGRGGGARNVGPGRGNFWNNSRGDNRDPWLRDDRANWRFNGRVNHWEDRAPVGGWGTWNEGSRKRQGTPPPRQRFRGAGYGLRNSWRGHAQNKLNVAYQ